jgi:hypothetical protein
MNHPLGTASTDWRDRLAERAFTEASGLDKWIDGDPGVGLDVEEDGQAECQKCGEWYHTTAPYGGHICEEFSEGDD